MVKIQDEPIFLLNPPGDISTLNGLRKKEVQFKVGLPRF
jgi:hypothetical protein